MWKGRLEMNFVLLSVDEMMCCATTQPQEQETNDYCFCCTNASHRREREREEDRSRIYEQDTMHSATLNCVVSLIARRRKNLVPAATARRLRSHIQNSMVLPLPSSNKSSNKRYLQTMIFLLLRFVSLLLEGFVR